ncbi:molybdopterin binding oxidoreductase [Lindgomyces ingoldianus]|uniref:Molybdopterin binding oxidoreductase n=1 Tax=Lindgomyces ingoldianus TaxID=673940 RepID=A0ACB6QZW0_9PLEO|nr:molybdopterin binding oxidoreductase [Lindgomyces ingoldianus]KAF2472543.1 molybdopterin binding oxidoreductase [Lindgomyces ingoldianus]
MAPTEPHAKPFEQQGDVPNFSEEYPVWGGYVEKEKYPEKQKAAAEILAKWEYYHYAMGPTLRDVPDISWKYVLEEKSSDMIHVLQFPYNGKPPRTEITSNCDNFVRNHGGIPEINPDHFFLEITGLTLGDGDELINTPWGEGAIGTAHWTGASLKKVIKYCGGLKEGGEHLELFGADTYSKKVQVYNYGVSVQPMNGKPLPKIHGAPLRAVVFGYIGAMSTKWLYRVNAITDPSEGPVQKKKYLYYTPQVGKHNATYSNSFSIQTMPISSAIMTPLNQGQIIHDGLIHMTVWAYSGGGWPERVEVSGDGGSIWYEVPYDKMSRKYFHAWRIWEFDLPVDAEGWLEFSVRTWDNALNTQPTYVRSAWNWDLHVTSSCRRIKVYSINRTKPMTAKRLKLLKSKGLSTLPITHPLEIDLESDEEYRMEMKKRECRDPEE